MKNFIETYNFGNMKMPVGILLFIMLLCVSCSSDNDTDEPIIIDIVGHWESVSSHLEMTFLNQNKDSITNEESDKTLVLRLYDDGTCQYNKYKGTYKLLGKELNIYTTKTEYTYDRDGNKFQTTRDVGYHYTILELKSDKMIIVSSEYIMMGIGGDRREKKVITLKKYN